MLGLILIYFIGKKFYDLAQEFGKSEWGFAILGVVVYYAGIFMGGFILGIMFMESIAGMNPIVIGLMALPFGIVSCVGLYYFLNNSWKKNIESNKSNIDDIGTH